LAAYLLPNPMSRVLFATSRFPSFSSGAHLSAPSHCRQEVDFSSLKLDADSFFLEKDGECLAPFLLARCFFALLPSAVTTTPFFPDNLLSFFFRSPRSSRSLDEPVLHLFYYGESLAADDRAVTHFPKRDCPPEGSFREKGSPVPPNISPFPSFTLSACRLLSF